QQQIDEMIRIVKQLCANLVHQLKPRAERDYHMILQVALTLAGMSPHAEYSTQHGRADIVVELADSVYVIEVKLNAAAMVALQQIEDRRYYERFLDTKKQVILLGISFIESKNALDIQYQMKRL